MALEQVWTPAFGDEAEAIPMPGASSSEPKRRGRPPGSRTKQRTTTTEKESAAPKSGSPSGNPFASFPPEVFEMVSRFPLMLAAIATRKGSAALIGQELIPQYSKEAVDAHAIALRAWMNSWEVRPLTPGEAYAAALLIAVGGGILNAIPAPASEAVVETAAPQAPQEAAHDASHSHVAGSPSAPSQIL